MWEVRNNEDGSLDEIVGSGEVQLEQMDKDHWFAYFQDGNQRLMLTMTATATISVLLEDESI